MKQLLTTLSLILFSSLLMSQDLEHQEKTFEEVYKCLSDTNQFFTDLKNQIHFPNVCNEHHAAELVELIIIWDSQKIEIASNALNPYFKHESEKMGKILEPLVGDCQGFKTKFYIHFDFEPWSYPNLLDEETNNGKLYNHNKYVIRGYGRPLIKKGG